MSLEKLAILGGPPAFSSPLHVNRPSAPNRSVFSTYVDAMFESRWFSNDGPLVAELEGKLARFLDVKHCITTTSGTRGLELVAHALGLRGEVIVPSFTFAATPHALQWQGLKPVFCDVLVDSLTIDPSACEALISPETTAIVGVHLWGLACHIDELRQLADRRGLSLFFDAAHAFGCRFQGRPLGGFGDAEVFSFHATKAFHTGEGGAITTNSDELASKLRLLRNFGFSGLDRVEGLGTNGKMSELTAALGLANLAEWDEQQEQRRIIHTRYQNRLADVAGITLRSPNPEGSNHHHVVAQVDPKALGLERDDLMQVLRAEGILARRYFYPGCHKMAPYSRDTYRLPHTEHATATCLALPAGAAVSTEQVDGVCHIISLAARQQRELRDHLRHRPHD